MLGSVHQMHRARDLIDEAIAHCEGHPTLPQLESLRDQLSMGLQQTTEFAKSILDPIEWEEPD
jgi:hypothetical protein